MAIRAAHLELENQQRIKDAKTLGFTQGIAGISPPAPDFVPERQISVERLLQDALSGKNSPSLRSAIVLASISAPASPLPAALALVAESASLRSRIQLLPRRSRFSPTHDSSCSARTTPTPSVYSAPPSSSTYVRCPHRTAQRQATARSNKYLAAMATPTLIVRPVSSPPASLRPPPTPPSCGAPCLIVETSPREAPLAHQGPVLGCKLCRPSRSSDLGVRVAHPGSLPLLASAAPNNKARDNELTVTADDDRIALAHSVYPYKDVEAKLRTSVLYEVAPKTTPVPFIRVSEPWPEPDNEVTLPHKMCAFIQAPRARPLRLLIPAFLLSIQLSNSLLASIE
ncbi:hypothetical protein K438DRAFT_1942448 [Mycena galopus ATCC 62051]|nr:hypothetical protein K438DRAFT_1942448 [Mycena galopus ATCC 62051]